MVAGGYQQTWQTRQYNVPILTRSGELVKILAMGMEEITTKLDNVDHRPTARMFLGIDPHCQECPPGIIDLLIVIQIAIIYPQFVDDGGIVGNLRILKLIFGTRYLLNGVLRAWSLTVVGSTGQHTVRPGGPLWRKEFQTI